MRKAKKTLLILTIVLSFYYLYTYTSEEKKYEILNEIIKDNNFYFSNIYKRADKITIFENNMGDFSLFDKLYVVTQKVIQGNYLFKENMISYYTHNPEVKHIANLVDSNFRTIDFNYSISLPIVSSDNKIAMVNISEDCGGGLCGYSGTFVFRKENGKWKVIHTYNAIIS